MKKEFLIQHKKSVDRLRKGDTKAQFEIYKLYYKAMYNTALRMVNSTQEAEDIMQEAFLSAFQNIKSYKGEVSFGAWLKRIVINKCLDFLKKKKIQFYELNENEKITVNEDVLFDNDNKKQIETIKAAILNLADGYRIVLSLYLLEGYDHNEISEILGITPSASRSQFTRAKQKLITMIEPK